MAVEGSRKEDVIQAKAAYEAAEKDHKRMKELIATNTVTQKQYDDVEMHYVSAKQTYEKLARGLRPEEIASVRARRDQASAQADLLRKRVHRGALCL